LAANIGVAWFRLDVARLPTKFDPRGGMQRAESLPRDDSLVVTNIDFHKSR
jgi:hypothetical protein